MGVIPLLSAHEQISMMGQITENQQKMQELTNIAIDGLTQKNEKLIDQQVHLLEVSGAHRLVA